MDCKGNKVKKEQMSEKLTKDEGKDKDKCFHCRKMIEKFIQTKSNIKSVSFVKTKNENDELVKTGDISFSVFMDEMGFDKETYLKYEKEFFSNFMIGFLGEFLVRENISTFVEKILEVEPQDFIQTISSKIHKKFGISVQGNVVTFTFHVSLLPKILTEELRSLDWL